MDKYTVLKENFGFSEFRPFQGEIIDTITSGRDTLAIMPTGAGKSICYQIPALMLPGVTVVISPLISLMLDQVNKLKNLRVPATCLYSGVQGEERKALLSEIRAGKYKLVYCSPEGLGNQFFQYNLMGANVTLLVVDEAHCVSQWGHDFRPSYRKIYDVVERLPHRPIIAAFTATATKKVEEDIEVSLHLADPGRFNTGFARENLFFRVVAAEEEGKSLDKEAFVRDYVNEHKEECGIIYCSTRKAVDDVFAMLFRSGVAARRYHSEVGDEERKRCQQEFLDGSVKVMVATNAFGMGIDKPDIRYVLHYAIPSCIENYYQEAGRAGRDGKPSECILLFTSRDIATQRHLMEDKCYDEATDTEKMVLTADDEYRLQKMIEFCMTSKCLGTFVEEYFGNRAGNCGHCYNCEKMKAAEENAAQEEHQAQQAAALVRNDAGKQAKMLLSKLKECRREIARANVFKSDFIKDAVLRKMISNNPQSVEELIAGKYMNRALAEKFGSQFLAVLADNRGE